MDESVDFPIPDCSEFRKGYEAYNTNETRGHCYFDAMSLLSQTWGNPVGMAKAVRKLIWCWNRFYAHFDYAKLARCIEANLIPINEFRARNIDSLSNADADRIDGLFDQFLDALAREGDNQQSAISVAKTFGLLAPDFLPLADERIMNKYHCMYHSPAIAGPKYVEFCKKMKLMAERVRHCVPTPDDRSLLKRIDEYNYAKYTKRWI